MSERLETLLKSRGRLLLDRVQFEALLQTEGDAISNTYVKGVLAGTEMMISVLERDIVAERLSIE